VKWSGEEVKSDAILRRTGLLVGSSALYLNTKNCRVVSEVGNRDFNLELIRNMRGG